MILAASDALTNGAFATAGGAAFVAVLNFVTGRTTRGDQVMDKAIARLEKDVERLTEENVTMRDENRTLHDVKIPALEKALDACQAREGFLNDRVARLEAKSVG